MSYTTETHIPCPQSEAHHQAQVAQIYLSDLIWQIDNLSLPPEQSVEIMRDIELAAELIQEAVETIQPGKPCDVDACDWPLSDFATRTEPINHLGELCNFLKSRTIFNQERNLFLAELTEAMPEYFFFQGSQWGIRQPIPPDILRQAVFAIEED